MYVCSDFWMPIRVCVCHCLFVHTWKVYTREVLLMKHSLLSCIPLYFSNSDHFYVLLASLVPRAHYYAVGEMLPRVPPHTFA